MKTKTNRNKKKNLIEEVLRLWFELENKNKFIFVLPLENAGGLIALQIRQAAKDGKPVIIHGPTGVGKELAARAIYSLSEHKSDTLSSINCAAIPNDVIENQLFGHVKGAFTGANEDKSGLIDAIGSDYIHLDEIGETSHSFQAKLLRLIEYGDYYKVGGSKKEESKARFIFTTNQPLKRLRPDFENRMVHKIHLKAINEYESGQIYKTLLLHVLSKKILDGLNGSGKRINISLGAVAELIFYDWPGNVRELNDHISKCLSLLIEQSYGEQDEFLSHMNFPDPPINTLVTLGLYNKYGHHEYFPNSLYREYVDLFAVFGPDIIEKVYIAFNKSLSAHTEPLEEVVSRYEAGKKPLLAPLLGKGYISDLSGNSREQIVNFLEYYLGKKDPIKEFERDLFQYFAHKYNTKLNWAEAAEKLGLSGQEALTRRLKKHNIEFITKSQFAIILQNVKNNRE